MNISFVKFNEIFLEATYRWLQDAELLYLIDAIPITKELQLVWFENLPNMTNYKIYGVMCDGIPIGVCGLKHVTESAGEYFGYIGEKNYWGIGIGKCLVEYIEAVARTKQLKSVYISVREDNIRAINLYKKMNYQINFKENYLIKMNKKL